MMFGKLIIGLILVAGLSARAESYVGFSGAMTLPQGGGDLRRLGGATLRGGTYLSDFWAIEGEVGWQENSAELGAGLLGHWTGWELYDRFFGFSAFDPFVTIGAKGWVGKSGEVGPSAGLGAFYHLGEEWSLRADAAATLGVERDIEMVYLLSVGLQYTF